MKPDEDDELEALLRESGAGAATLERARGLLAARRARLEPMLRALEASSHAMLSLDVRGVVLACNPAAQRLARRCGLRLEPGARVSETLSARLAPVLRAASGRAAGDSVTLELELGGAMAHELHQVRVDAHRDPRGQLDGYVLSLTPAADGSPQELLARAHSALSREGLAIVDGSGTLSWCSARMAELLGQPDARELVGRRLDELFDRATLSALSGLDAREPHAPPLTGIEASPPGGRRLRVSLAPLVRRGQRLGTALVACDASEATARTAPTARALAGLGVPFGVWTLEQDGVCWQCGEPQLFEALLGAPLAAHPRQIEATFERDEALRRAWARACSGLPALVEVTRGEQTLAVALLPASRDGSGPLGAVWDVSERVGLEHRLGLARRMEVLGRLTEGVAHDFNNLLTVILSYAESLRYELPEIDPRRRDVDEIRVAAGRAATLSRQLLTFSQRQPGQARRVDLNRTIEGLGKLLERVIGADIEIRVRLDEGLGSVVMDTGQLEQILFNLALRARDAMPAGGQLSIATANVLLDPARAATLGLAPGHYARLSVSDTGTPLDAASREVLAGATARDAADSSLAAVHAAAAECRGAITVESGDEDRGSRLDVFLPWSEQPERTGSPVQPPAADPFERPASTAALGAPPRHEGGLTILLVEDDSALRRLTARVLRDQGYEVLAARDGEHALAKVSLHERPVDLLVTDIVMPRMGGREVAAQLLRLNPELKVLFTSGYTEQPVKLDDARAATSFLPKPYTRSALLRDVRTLLERDARH